MSHQIIKWWNTQAELPAVIIHYTLELPASITDNSLLRALQKGHLCGYVGIGPNHPLHGKGYSDTATQLKRTALENTPIGKRGIIPLLCLDKDTPTLPIDVWFDVHGGVTYARNYQPGGQPDGRWWFGFDCAHCDDTIEVQNEAYVTEECERFAAALAAIK